MSRTLLLLVSVVVACGGNSEDAGAPDAAPDASRAIADCSPELPAPGGTCTEAGQRCWGLQQSTCSESQTQTVCECSNGTWDCAPAAPAAGDPVCFAGAGCYTEGHALCDDQPPADRHCQCDASGSTWSCSSICDGCPASVPSEGDACTAIPEGHCPYAARDCTCVAGAFHCTP